MATRWVGWQALAMRPHGAPRPAGMHDLQILVWCVWGVWGANLSSGKKKL